MIRGPVLPQAREALWALLADRLDVIERGLSLVREGVDCSDGEFGLVDGLARDARGAPVLVMIAVDGDSLLPARALAAAEFLSRVGDGLVAAVAEANLCPGVPGRVLVAGGSAGSDSLELMRRLVLPGLEVCRLEAFRLGGTERFAVRWLGARTQMPSSPAVPAPPGFEVPPGRLAEWEAVQRLCERLDPAIRIDGDRFQRRITWQGRPLGEVIAVDGDLLAIDEQGGERRLGGDRDVRLFADAVVRRYVHVAGLGGTREASAASDPHAANRTVRGAESLRETLTSSRVSAEEYSALGETGAPATAELAATEAKKPAEPKQPPDGSGTVAGEKRPPKRKE